MSKKIISHPVFLCGMMGSGKSTIGKHVAKELDVPFTDLDALIVESEGMTIPEIFAQKQEEGFRKIERKQLIKLVKTAEGVIALGGGSLQNQQITDHLKMHGWLVFIDASQAEIMNRLSEPSGRPMLQHTGSVTERISSLFEERMRFYEQAHISIQTEKKPVKQVATEIVKKLTLYEGRDYR